MFSVLLTYCVSNHFNVEVNSINSVLVTNFSINLFPSHDFQSHHVIKFFFDEHIFTNTIV